MTKIKYILIFFAGLLGAGFLVTVCGLMFYPSYANLWTQGLMWSLLGSLVLAPVCLFVDFSSTHTSPTQEPAQESTSPNGPPPFEPEPAPFDWPRDIDKEEYSQGQ